MNNPHIAVTIAVLDWLREQDEQTITLGPDDYVFHDTRPCPPVTLSEPGRV
jgi:hypothetical protein